MVFVKKAQGQSDDQLIRNFTRKVMESNIIQEVKDRRFHLNKQEKKKLAEQQLRRLKRKVQ
jgi:ribosomal protein S21